MMRPEAWIEGALPVTRLAPETLPTCANSHTCPTLPTCMSAHTCLVLPTCVHTHCVELKLLSALCIYSW